MKVWYLLDVFTRNAYQVKCGIISIFNIDRSLEYFKLRNFLMKNKKKTYFFKWRFKFLEKKESNKSVI